MPHEILGSGRNPVRLTAAQATILTASSLITLCDGCTAKRQVSKTKVYHLHSVYGGGGSEVAEWQAIDTILALPCIGACYSEFEEGRACTAHGRPSPG